MSETGDNTENTKPKTSKLAKLSLGLSIISILCLVSFFFTVTDTARFVFIFSVVLAVILSVVSLFKIKLSGGKLKDMESAIIGLIIPVFLIGIVLMGIVLGGAVDSATVVVRVIKCKRQLESLGKAMQIYSTDFNKYPTADKWCDLLVEHSDITEIQFKCPSRKKERSSYAMNPYCKANSSGDVVLLFETKGRWNQFGRTELLTAENHEGKGCNVLFNDSRVEFVKLRDFDKLKWKDEKKNK